MIERIGRLRDCRIFRDFTWPSDLHNFARFNLIYGWNGSGKTTISRIFRDLEHRRRPVVGDVIVSIGGQNIRGVEFSDASIPVRVFNKDFVTENVFPTGGGDVPPILILGEESIEKQLKLEAQKAELLGIEQSLSVARREKGKLENQLDRHCVDRGGVVKELLRGSGSNPYNNYHKGNYKTRAEQMVADGDAENHHLEEAERETLFSQHRASPKAVVQEVPNQSHNFPSLRERTTTLLSYSVVSETIQSLRDDAEIGEWVHKGLQLHKERDAVECLYCGQPIQHERLSAMERYFNAEYEKFNESVDELAAEITQITESWLALSVPHSTQLYEHLEDEYTVIQTEFEDYRTQTTDCLNALTKALADKKGTPFDPIILDNYHAQLLDSDVTECLNQIIRKHNEASTSHAESTVYARKKLERAMVTEKLGEFVDLTKRAKSQESFIANSSSNVKTLQAEISKLESEITEHRGPADELNVDLQKYIGHKELQLEVKENGYTLIRNGVPATQLSEGETTAIALLYFLKSLKDHRFDFSDGVVVLDDPISSLDANALFLAYGFIQERTRNAGQLFILTHNFTFFRQVRNWFHYLGGQRNKDWNKRPARFYMLNCLTGEGGRYSDIQNLDPLLERYESDYHYLFACVLRGVTPSTSGLESNYVLPNMARRLLEAFLAFRQPDLSGGLWEKMQNVDFEEAKKSQILRFVNTYSHNDSIVEPEHDPALLGEAPAVLSDLLQLIKSQDKDHYDRMVKLVNQETEAEED